MPVIDRLLRRLDTASDSPPDASEWRAILDEAVLARGQLESSRIALNAAQACTWELDLRTGEVLLTAGWATMLGQPAAPTRTSLVELSQMVPV